MSDVELAKSADSKAVAYGGLTDPKSVDASLSKRIALVFGTVPSHEEIEQYQLLYPQFEFTLITAQSVADYIQSVCFFKDLNIVSLPDHDENPSFLPGLERALVGYDFVIVKERVGLFAYQAVKSKWVNNFKLFVVVDNVTPFPGEDIRQMKTIRDEVTAAADGIIVQSKLIENMLTTVEGVDKQKIFYITPYVKARRVAGETERVRALESLKLHDGDFLVAAFGQIEWEEGLLDIVHAIKHVHEREGEYCKVKLAICGVGSFDQDLLDRINALGIAHAIRLVEPSRAATLSILSAANLMFSSTVQSRDRLEGDPFRVLLALGNGIAMLSGRTPLIEEMAGKHRIDFCLGSPRSIADAVSRAKEATGLLSNIKSKNHGVVSSRYASEIFLEDFQAMMTATENQMIPETTLGLIKQVAEVETLVNKQQYLDAISMVERLFGEEDLPVHHRANLYRLIGDSFAKLLDNKSARESYSYALELDPFLPKAYLGLGAVNLSESNFNASIINFQKAISYAPQDDMANLGLGLSFQGLAEHSEARTWIVRSLDLNAGNEMGVYSLVRLSNETGVYTGCVKALETFLEIKPDQSDMAYALAGVLFKEKMYKKAKKTCEGLLKVDAIHEKVSDLYRLILEAMEVTIKPNTKSKLG